MIFALVCNECLKGYSDKASFISLLVGVITAPLKVEKNLKFST